MFQIEAQENRRQTVLMTTYFCNIYLRRKLLGENILTFFIKSARIEKEKQLIIDNTRHQLLAKHKNMLSRT